MSDADAHPSVRARLPPASSLTCLPQPALTGLVCDCAAHGDIDGIRILLDARADPNEGTAYDMRTPLHLAAAAGDLKLAKFLIEECGASLRRDRFGLLPIHDAVQNGHNEVRRYLQSWKLSGIDAVVQRHKALKLPAEASSRSVENVFALGDQMEPLPEIMSTVFELVVKEGIFSFTTVQAEVEHFFNCLGFHRMYYQHFTPMQIAKHVQCLIAAKHVAHATNHIRALEFDFSTEHTAFFLTTLSSDLASPTESQRRTERKIADFIGLDFNNKSITLTFMASQGPAFRGESERLGIYNIERGHFEVARVAENETSLNVLASSTFLKGKTREAIEQYQIIMEDVVASRRSMVNIIPGEAYPGNFSGFVVLFATAETAGRNYFQEAWQAMRFLNLVPRRLYFSTFANGVIAYSLFFPAGVPQTQIEKLKRALLYSTLLKATPENSALVYKSVMQSQISHECGLYVLAAVKFVYTFFPKEQYAPEYMSVHKVLEHDAASQRKLETLYKLCIKDLLSTERIYSLIHRHPNLARLFFDDFSRIAHGQAEPRFNEQLSEVINDACTDQQDRQILNMFLTFNHSILLTNFFKNQTPGALSFRLDPAVALKDRPTSLYPEVPYGIYLVCGRDFMGFHTRFRDVARGGIRLVLSRDKTIYDRNFATLFDECYNLAFTQQYKNKDIPEGGSKGVILPDRSWPNGQCGNVVAGSSLQGPLAMRSCFTRYLDALLDCMMPDESGIYAGHLKGRQELLFFGPDENTAGFMDMGAKLAKARGYPFWKALTTGKSVALGGVPHDTYGMTTSSVHTYVTELLRELGEDETKITKFQTGGPDGDLGSNEILMSKDMTVGIVDGSGVLYDPSGICRAELTRLAQRRVPIKEFNRCFLGNGGFLVTVDESNVVLPDGSSWLTGAELRDNFHLTDYATADLFVPCGGRPNAVTTDNVKKMFTADGLRPKFRMIVEGANLFFSDRARGVLETAGVHVFKDASTNKGGVNSSSLEVFAALALSEEDHSAMMCYNPTCGDVPPAFYETYVTQIQETIVENARREFQAIWKCNSSRGISKVQATKMISSKINLLCDAIMAQCGNKNCPDRDRLFRSVLQRAVPPAMMEHLGVEGILQRVPSNYVEAIVGAWVASRFVYSQGVDASEVSFFFFLQSLLSNEDLQEF
mmetsp:Transcript_40612/g.94315  ORF Transcript_40612/g.94315 Transcript_40612/m.94315 type:complete len:1161 (-) Transcript_40612:134-3616(-)